MRYLVFSMLFFSVTTTSFSQYYSQCDQDKFINETFFKNKKNGTFVDVGAHDGVTISNTYFFEKELFWNGICVEPIPEVFALLRKNRRCKCIQGCISKETFPADFLRINGPLEMLSGLVNKYDAKHVERIQLQLKQFGGSYEVLKVQCYSLNDILNREGINHVDFLSLDTEGGELEILQSIDFGKFHIDVITVENNYSDPTFVPFMEAHGYKYVKSLEQDMIFVNRNVLLNLLQN